MRSLAYLNKYLYKYRYRLLLGVFCVMVSNALSIAPAVLIRKSLDLFAIGSVGVDALSMGPSLDVKSSVAHNLIRYALFILLLAALKGVFMFWMRQTIIVASRLMEYDLKNEIYAHYQRLSPHFFRMHSTGDLITRISEDVSKVRMYLGPAMMYGLNTLLLFLMIVPFMCAVNAKLTAYVLAPLPLLSLIIYLVNNVINRQSGKVQRALSGLSTFCQEAFAGVRVIKSFAREDDFHDIFRSRSEAYRGEALRLARVNALFFPMMLFFSGASVILVIYVGSLQVMDHVVSVGNIAEFIIYVNLLMWPFTAVGWISSITQQAAASQGRINEFLRTAPDIVSRRGLRTPIIGDLSFLRLSLRHRNTGIWALRNITLQVAAGRSYAIVGGIGSGKTTLLSLVGRLIDPTEGAVSLDGVDIRDYDVQHLREHIAYVPQDGFLFSDTIANNILLLGAHPTRLQRLVEDTHLQHDIASFSRGVDTLVGERGVMLSGGQRQRIALARALSREARLLLLDDCLSAVDAKTEARIFSNLRPYMRTMTTLLVTHRISTARLADVIVVLQDGKMQHTGTHDELLTCSTYYQSLYKRQQMGDHHSPTNVPCS